MPERKVEISLETAKYLRRITHVAGIDIGKPIQEVDAAIAAAEPTPRKWEGVFHVFACDADLLFDGQEFPACWFEHEENSPASAVRIRATFEEILP